MRRLAILALALFLLLTGCSFSKDTAISISPSPATTQKAKPVSADFRYSSWGATRQAVKNSESGSPKVEGDDILVYDVDLFGLSFECFYSFNEAGQLCQGLYSLTETHSNDNQYIKDYETIKEELIKKYGKPSLDTVNWSDTLFKDDVEEYGFAVSAGHLAYIAQWINEKTEVSILLNGDNYETQLSVLYESTTIKPPKSTSGNVL